MKRDLERLLEIWAEMKEQGIGPVLKRIGGDAWTRVRTESAVLVKQAFPYTAAAFGLLIVISFLGRFPLDESLILGGLVIALLGIVQAAGAHGLKSPERNVMQRDSSVLATDDPEEQQKIRNKRREEGRTLMAKMLTAAFMLIFFGVVLSLVLGPPPSEAVGV